MGKSFNGSEKQKLERVNLWEDHKKKGRIDDYPVPRTYGGRFRGSPIDCILFNSKKERERFFYSKKEEEVIFASIDYGWPQWLILAMENIHRALPEGERHQWPLRLVKAVPVGVDLNKIWPIFMAAVYKDILLYSLSSLNSPMLASVIQGGLALYEEEANLAAVKGKVWLDYFNLSTEAWGEVARGKPQSNNYASQAAKMSLFSSLKWEETGRLEDEEDSFLKTGNSEGMLRAAERVEVQREESKKYSIEQTFIELDLIEASLESGIGKKIADILINVIQRGPQEAIEESGFSFSKCAESGAKKRRKLKLKEVLRLWESGVISANSFEEPINRRILQDPTKLNHLSAKGQLLYLCCGYSLNDISFMCPAFVLKECTKLLGITTASCVFFTDFSVNHHRKDSKIIALQNPEILLGKNGDLAFKFWAHLDAMNSEQWIITEGMVDESDLSRAQASFFSPPSYDEEGAELNHNHLDNFYSAAVKAAYAHGSEYDVGKAAGFATLEILFPHLSPFKSPKFLKLFGFKENS